MKIRYIITLLLLSLKVSGQDINIDSLTCIFTSQLRQNQIDTILTYKDNCVGCESMWLIELNDSIISYGDPKVSYVFWRKRRKDFITKLIEYDLVRYNTISIEANEIWDLYFKHKISIAKERILPPKYVDNNDTIIVENNHFNYSQIEILYPVGKFNFEINHYYFTKIIDDGHENLSLHRNNLTYKKLLQEMIIEKIKEIENRKLFEPVSYRKKIKWHKC